MSRHPSNGERDLGPDTTDESLLVEMPGEAKPTRMQRLKAVLDDSIARTVVGVILAALFLYLASRASSAVSIASPASWRTSRSRSAGVRGMLPTWVVRMRSSLRRMSAHHPRRAREEQRDVGRPHHSAAEDFHARGS